MFLFVHKCYKIIFCLFSGVISSLLHGLVCAIPGHTPLSCKVSRCKEIVMASDRHNILLSQIPLECHLVIIYVKMY